MKISIIPMKYINIKKYFEWESSHIITENDVYLRVHNFLFKNNNEVKASLSSNTHVLFDDDEYDVCINGSELFVSEVLSEIREEKINKILNEN